MSNGRIGPPWWLMARGGAGGYRTVSGPVVYWKDKVVAPLKSLLVNIDPVQAGSGDPSPDNVRPISGWTGANVWRTGKNLAKSSTTGSGSARGITYTWQEDGSIVFSGTGTSTGVQSFQEFTLPAGTYYWSRNYNKNTGFHLRIRGKINGVTTTIRASNGIFTLEQDTQMDVVFYVESGLTVNNERWTYQVEAGSVQTAYEPYQGDTYSITFPAEAGTVYRGTLDVTNGVLTVTHKRVDMGDLDWFYTTATFEHRFFVVDISDGQHQNTGTHDVTFWCSSYKALPQTVNGTTMGSIVDDCCIAVNQRGQSYPLRIFLRDDSYAGDAEALKTSVTGQTLVYPLEIPLTYQLTPQEVMTLLGTNNIWADTGDVTVEYLSGEGNPALVALALAHRIEE